MDFGKVLRGLRKEDNIGQKELASYLNVSVSTISNYENGVHAPDLETLCRLADFFKVSVDFLLERTGYRHPLDSLNAKFSDGTDVCGLVNTIVMLESQKQYAVRDFVEFMAKRDHPGTDR